MIKQVDVEVTKPGNCPLRNCSVDAEIQTDYDKYCYCENHIGGKYNNVPCINPEAFPVKCPLSKHNINVWRSV